MTFTDSFLRETVELVQNLDSAEIEKLATGIAAVRDRGGRLFILGVGGSAGSASHAVNDFRKICEVESYSPIDNVSELTARANDEGWDTTFAAWLGGSRLDADDAVLVFSVGGGNAEKQVSTNIVAALDLAKERGASIFGIVGRDGGHTAELADACVDRAAPLQRPHHPAHRGAVLRDLAPAGQPPGPRPARRPSGSRSYDAAGSGRRAAAPHLRRRRRRLHRQPLRRAGCSATRPPSRSPSTTTSPPGATGTSRRSATTPG